MAQQKYFYKKIDKKFLNFDHVKIYTTINCSFVKVAVTVNHSYVYPFVLIN